MDIVEKIANVVLPQVLDNPQSQEKEANLVTQFITIFASKIAGNDAEPTVDATDDGVKIIQDIFPQAEDRGELITKLSEIHDVDEAKTQGLLATSAPLVLGQLSSLSGGSSISSFLKEHLSILGDRLPSWATSILPASLLGALGAVGAGISKVGDKVADTVGGAVDAASDTAKDTAQGAKELAGDAKQAAANVAEDVADTGGSLVKALLPIVGLIVLGLLALFLWKQCQPSGDIDGVVPTPIERDISLEEEVSATESVEPASFNITTGTGDAVYACNGQVGDQGLKDKIIASVKNIFAGSDTCDNTIEVNGDYATTLSGMENMDKALEAIKAVPNASAQFVSGQLVVDAPDMDALNALVDKLQDILPDVTVAAVAPLNIEDEVKQGVEGAMAALDKLGPSATSAQIARALNLQVINFAVGGDTIPAENQRVLDKAAQVIQSASDITLGITGHTDSTGNADANLKLSQERAASVRDYFINKGVSADSLTTIGVGSSEPVATNETENGRFRNRRIAFSADAVLADVVADVADAAGSAVAGAGDALDTVVEKAGDAVDAAVKGTGSAADSIAEGINEAAQATGDAMKKAADETMVEIENADADLMLE